MFSSIFLYILFCSALLFWQCKNGLGRHQLTTIDFICRSYFKPSSSIQKGQDEKLRLKVKNEHPSRAGSCPWGWQDFFFFLQNSLSAGDFDSYTLEGVGVSGRVYRNNILCTVVILFTKKGIKTFTFVQICSLSNFSHNKS